MVTVVGGGIAGTVLAGALAREGIPASVYERRADVGSGAFLIIDGRAHRALTELGVGLDKLYAASHEVRGLGVHDVTGNRVVPGDGRRLYSRSDLTRVLTDFAQATAAEFRYGSQVTDVDIETGRLRIADQMVTTESPIIAADGIDSIVRARLEPGRPAVYAGQVVIYGTTAEPITLPSEESVLHFHRIGTDQPSDAFGHMWNEETTVWFARVGRAPIPVADTGFHPVDEWSAEIHSVAPAISDLVNLLLARTETVHVSNARNVPLADALPTRDDVILCGDADHAISPAAGVGARDAIEDVAAIYRAIVAGGSIADAMTTRRDQIRTEREQVAQIYGRGR